MIILLLLMIGLFLYVLKLRYILIRYYIQQISNEKNYMKICKHIIDIVKLNNKSKFIDTIVTNIQKSHVTMFYCIKS